MRAIDADRFLAQIEDQYMEHDITREKYMDLEDRIMQQPTIEERKTQWIPCSLELPEETGKYLVTVKNGNVYAGTYDGYSKRFQCEAIAWMPLPLPYQGEGEEE